MDRLGIERTWVFLIAALLCWYGDGAHGKHPVMGNLLNPEVKTEIAEANYDYDLPDLQGLLAPLPLLVDIGANDRCFHSDNATAFFSQVEAIYGAAGLADRLHLDLSSSIHAWGGNNPVGSFSKYL